MKFQDSSYSVRKNALVKNFRKSQSNYPKNFLLRENRQKDAAFTPYSRLLEIAKPLNYIIFKSLGKKRGQRKQLHLWQVSKASQLQYYLVKILQDNAFFYSVEKCQKSCLHHFSKFRKFSPSFTLGIIY